MHESDGVAGDRLAAFLQLHSGRGEHVGYAFPQVPFFHCGEDAEAEFQDERFADNVARDERNEIRLKEAGWKVVVVWECEIRSGEAEALLKERLA